MTSKRDGGNVVGGMAGRRCERGTIGGCVAANTSSSGITPSGMSLPKAQMKRIGNSSAATSMAISACATAPMRDDVMMALAPIWRSADRQFVPPPQHRQRHRDHAGAQDGQKRHDAFDRVGQLHCHDGIGLQAQPAQLGGKRRYGAVGLRESELAWRAVGKACAVGRIDQGKRPRLAHRRAAKQFIERGAGAAGLAIRLFIVSAQDHAAPLRHHVSGR